MDVDTGLGWCGLGTGEGEWESGAGDGLTAQQQETKEDKCEFESTNWFKTSQIL